MSDISRNDKAEQILRSINSCLSVSVDSCEKCVCKDISHPRCIKELLRESKDLIISYYNDFW